MPLSLNYPIKATIGATIDEPTVYVVSVDGEEFFEGKAYSQDGSAPEIDMRDLFREKLDPKYEEINLSGAFSGVIEDSVKTFTIDVGGSFVVAYNHNTDYVTDVPDGANLNRPIQTYVDPRQVVGTSTMASGGITVSHSNPEGNPGDTIMVGEIEYTIVPECRNRYALYYMNKEGGLDYLLVHGRAIENYSSDRVDVELYADTSEPLSFSQTRIYEKVNKKYNCYTGTLTDEGAANIDNLIYSPKIFIHDLDTGIVQSCIMETNSISVKYKRWDGLPFLNFQVKESKKFER